MEVRDAGRTRVSRPVQEFKAAWLMNFSPSEVKVGDARSRSNAPAGMCRDAMPVQNSNALTPIDRRLAGRCKPTMPEHL